VEPEMKKRARSWYEHTLCRLYVFLYQTHGIPLDITEQLLKEKTTDEVVVALMNFDRHKTT
jgi:alanyl-tRNA synthetase